MKSDIFLPKRINVGFQNRSDTYTKKLAYITYFDEKDKLRKEHSWNSWRDEKIEPKEFTNEPTSGFVLNKKAGGYDTGWNHRQTYVRVYDPRDFEFEINIENLLYILENASSIKGKGLEGEFVYGWSGKDLILIPVESPDYKEMQEYNEVVHNNEYIKARDLVVGYTYLNKKNEKWVYMGRFDYWNYEYTDYWKNNQNRYKIEQKGKRHFFAMKRKNTYDDNIRIDFDCLNSLSKKFIGVESEECCEDYAELFEKMESNRRYSPMDCSKNEIVDYTYDEFLEKIGDRSWTYVYDKNENKYEVCKYWSDGDKNHNDKYFLKDCNDKRHWYEVKVLENATLEQIFEYVKPIHKNIYLQNNKLYERMY